MRFLLFLPFCAGLLSSEAADFEPLASNVRRISAALDYLGAPLSSNQSATISKATSAAEVQNALQPLCLLEVEINSESRVRVTRGGASAELPQNGWRTFLVKVVNHPGVTAPLEIQSPNALPLPGSPKSDLPFRWLDLHSFDQQPLTPNLSGLEIEYRILQLYSREAGKREATFSCTVGQGTQDLGFRGETPILFDCKPARKLTLRVIDENSQPTTGCFVIRDLLGRVYPTQPERLAPDFSFQSQVYRADGESIDLAEGEFDVDFSRGPESLVEHRRIKIGAAGATNLFQMKRWIDPAKLGWWSGDHHIHAAGCAHYSNPSQGVLPADMERHCVGEDLKVGCNLTWGPCFDYQKQFFCGAIDKVSSYPYLLRYDIEVSGFGSHQSGHLCLLRLKEENYPGGVSTNQWPTLGLNTLRWAKKQGAITGTAHSGYGLKVTSAEIPNYTIPPYNGIGANEFIVDVTHQVCGPGGEDVPAVDFFSLGDTPAPWELNMWYHVLNAGFRTRASGETDFPCISSERVGLGRTYVKLDGPLDFDSWCEGVRLGRSYVSDGRSHLIDFRANGVRVGEQNPEVNLTRPGTVRLTVKAAARLDETPRPDLQALPFDKKPFWHLERARIGTTRSVPVEVVVNGISVATNVMPADGVLRDILFDVPIAQSCWVALRILPSSHTNPIWVRVDGKVFKPRRKSVEWCLAGVDQCWSQKEKFIRAEEVTDARRAYEHARETYRALLHKAAE